MVLMASLLGEILCGLHVADYGCVLHIFDRYNNCIICFGQWDELEDFFHPVGIVFDQYNNVNIYAADTHNHRVQKFSHTSQFMYKSAVELLLHTTIELL